MVKIKEALNKAKLILLDYFKIVKLLIIILLACFGVSILIMGYLFLPIVPFLILTEIPLYQKIILSFILFLFQLYILEVVKGLFMKLAKRLSL